MFIFFADFSSFTKGFLEYGVEYFFIDGLRQKLIHLMYPGLLDIFWFAMTRGRYNFRLLTIKQMIKSANFITGFIAINNRHTAIHENKTVNDVIFVLIGNLVECLLSVFGFIEKRKDLLSKRRELQLNFNGHDVKGFIIHHQNTNLFLTDLAVAINLCCDDRWLAKSNFWVSCV